jgi:transposase InsO family protein
VRYAFIEAEKAHFPIAFMCKHLRVSTSGFYAHRTRPPSKRATDDARLLAAIRAIYAKSRNHYGSVKIHRALVKQGHRVSRDRVARLMRQNGLFGRKARRFRHTTDSGHALPVAPNTLDRKFEADAPNKVWVTDITYVPTREGWLYLAAILDLYSRRVVGWAMSARIDRALTLDALRMALGTRRPTEGLLHHSDRGSQYASGDYQNALATRGIACSMSRKGNCWDNAVAESFFATLKTELVYLSDWSTRDEATAAIFEYIEVFYNGERLHSHLGYVSPVEYELKNEELRKAA